MPLSPIPEGFRLCAELGIDDPANHKRRNDRCPAHRQSMSGALDASSSSKGVIKQENGLLARLRRGSVAVGIRDVVSDTRRGPQGEKRPTEALETFDPLNGEF